MPPSQLTPRVVLLSGRRARQRVWHASQYEFEDVVVEVDAVRTVTPDAPSRPRSRLDRVTRSVAEQVAQRLPRPPAGRREPLAEADLFFAVFAAPHELADLEMVRHDLEACRTKVAFVVEMWEPRLGQERHLLRHLRGFDHVFLFNRAVMPAVAEITGAAVSYLPTATDTLVFAPTHPGSQRPIDVSAYGHRLAGTHRGLVDAAAARRLHYAFDTVRGPFDVQDPREHRLALAQQLNHSRYAVVYRNNEHTDRLRRTGGEETVTNRQFEVLAAGAVLLGSRPRVPDFDACFDWPDAIIDIPAPAPDIEGLIAQLDRDPARLAAARAANVHGSLTRHDWAHRWRRVLDVAGLPPLPGLAAREARLAQRAASFAVPEPQDARPDAGR